MTITINRIGLQALYQDLGRPGYSPMGVGRSGAFDRRALRQGNTLVGNQPGRTGIEIVGGQFSIIAADDHLIALTGAAAAATIGGDPVTHGRVLSLRRGQILALGAVTTGLRTYLTVAGGFDVAEVLGSASTDTLSGLGPRPLRAGDRLAVHRREGLHNSLDVPSLIGAGELTVRVRLGPRDDWFTPDDIRQLFTAAWTVGTDTDRIGLRLAGPSLQRRHDIELLSEPCVRGSIQVSTDGQPIVFGPDHPVTGGYPVIAVIADRDLDALAQVRPGEILRFTR